MNDLQLRFINQLPAAADAAIVIFQKDINAPASSNVTAWKVIRKIGVDIPHPFVYPVAPEIEGIDTYKKYRERLPADLGQRFVMEPDSLGESSFFYKGEAEQPNVIEVLNNLMQDMIDAVLYLNGKPVSALKNIGASQRAFFNIPIHLSIGVLPEIGEGTIDPSTVGGFTELSFDGIIQADITLRQGDSPSMPYRFGLEQITHR